jgi:hypothetical protein
VKRLGPAARSEENARRLRTARAEFGWVEVRLFPFVHLNRKVSGYQCLLGQSWKIRLAEVVDVWDLLADTRRFWASWRPMRRRTDTSKASVRAAWEGWERSAGDLLP